MIRPRLLVLSLVLAAAAASAAPPLVQDALRGATPIPEESRPPLLTNAVNDDQRRTRNYDMQPPIIPHRVDGYQVDRNFNKCLDCHARARTEFSQAVPVSVTHYIDRDGKVLAQVSTRRYFCQQCHVAQEPVKPLVGNTFEDVDTVLRRAAVPAKR
ncbi:nitrate reductase cytochrome c-type subunit [Rhizobacter sp. P5_C2]